MQYCSNRCEGNDLPTSYQVSFSAKVPQELEPECRSLVNDQCGVCTPWQLQSHLGYFLLPAWQNTFSQINIIIALAVSLLYYYTVVQIRDALIYIIWRLTVYFICKSQILHLFLLLKWKSIVLPIVQYLKSHYFWWKHKYNFLRTRVICQFNDQLLSQETDLILATNSFHFFFIFQ